MVRKKYQIGQIALIALLVLTIATTVGLSLIARTTTDVSVTRNIEESTRAFSAAEAGVEEALISRITIPKTTIDPTLGVSYSVQVDPVNGSVGNPFEFSQPTSKEVTETVWLVAHDATGKIIETPTYTNDTIDVCWSSDPTTTPAIIVAVLYHKFGGSYQVAKVVYDPDSRIPNVSPTTAGGCSANTAYTGTINFPGLGITPASDILIALRIRPVYSGTQIAIAPAQDLPTQGNRIESVGVTEGGVNRKIIVYQQYRAPDSIFDYAVYSEGSFSQ